MSHRSTVVIVLAAIIAGVVLFVTSSPSSDHQAKTKPPDGVSAQPDTANTGTEPKSIVQPPPAVHNPALASFVNRVSPSGLFEKPVPVDWPGAPGQGSGNDNPPAEFADHAVILFEGLVYDPSYGIGPVSSLHQWQRYSLDYMEYWNEETGKRVYELLGDDSSTRVKFR